MGNKRRNHSPEFKAQIALEALRGDKTIETVKLLSGWLLKNERIVKNACIF